jgi:hypothetical protein
LRLEFAIALTLTSQQLDFPGDEATEVITQQLNTTVSAKW